MEQIGVFDFLYKNYKITKPIRLIEFFAGYGSQALALKYLGVPFEHWKICEWAVKSIQAYRDIHYDNVNIDYSKKYNKEYLISYLYDKHISMDYNKPMTKEQIARLSEQQLRTIYNNIQIEKNTVDIQQTGAEDLNIIETYKYDYILTYSFPCQDLSLAGKRKGMSDTSTRSGMLWEVERILNECKELETLPRILLMENVPQVHSQENIEDFRKWQFALEKLGYQSYWQDLIATDYGIPQTRNRCFMISILGEYNYNFPKPIPLKLKLKDLLEDDVDEKYYLSDKMIEFFTHNEQKQKENGNGFRFNVSNGDVIAKTITTRAGSRMNDNFVYNKSLKETLEKSDLENINDVAYIDGYNKKIRKDDLANTITTRVSASNNDFLLIKNNTKQGYLKAKDGDGVDISSRMEHHRGTVQKDKCQTLTTASGNERGVCVKTIGNYSPSNHNASRIVDKDYVAPTVMENHGTITATQTSDLRIRKLTPRECFRLMGVRDEDFDKVAKNQSDSSLYHLAGDSIIVNVLMAIFKEML